jgi:hypothetical protein
MYDFRFSRRYDLMMEAARSSRTLAYSQNTTRRNNPDDHPNYLIYLSLLWDALTPKMLLIS